MKTPELNTIRKTTIIFITCLALSGITAFPLRSELTYLMKHRTELTPTLQHWIETLNAVINQTPDIILYGTDWLAFAHLVIATFFIGVYINPVRNKFIVQTGMIACVAIFPLAFICGPMRGIPFFHQLIDCSFGIIGLVPLLIIYRNIKMLEFRQAALSKSFATSLS